MLGNKDLRRASAVFSQLISVLTMHAAKTIAESGN